MENQLKQCLNEQAHDDSSSTREIVIHEDGMSV
jgi:hypothetical protein